MGLISVSQCSQLLFKDKMLTVHTRGEGIAGCCEGCWTGSGFLRYLGATFSHPSLPRTVLHIPKKHFVAGQQLCKLENPSESTIFTLLGRLGSQWGTEQLCGCRALWMPAARSWGVGLPAVQLTAIPAASRAWAVVGPMAANLTWLIKSPESFWMCWRQNLTPDGLKNTMLAGIPCWEK